MRQTLLAKQFIKESKNQEISPALFNSAVPIQTSGWNRDVYFYPYYKTRLPYPTFLSMNGKEGALFYCIDKTRKLGEEIFNACIQNPHHLKRIKKEYLQLSKQIQKIYIQTAERSTQKATEPQLKKSISSIIHAMWKLNARLFYTIPIDENLLTNLVELNKLPIPADRQKLLWKTAVQYGGISFDTRRKIHFASQLSKGLSLHTLSEQFNYFYTNYNTYSETSQTLAKLEDDYKDILNIQKAKKFILHQRQLQRKTLLQFKQALKKFTNAERNIIHFVIAAIQLRDIRKDDIAKTCAVVYKIGKNFLTNAKIPHSLIFYCSLPELLKGPKYLQKHKTLISKRVKGFSVLVSGSGKLSYQYGRHAENMQFLEECLLKGNTNFSSNILRGQIANPGRIKGKVRVIKSLSAKGLKFQRGNILVTGMTRPEYIYIMKRAAAIITDEGGITSHAAIVSRELGIPCVIGTKIATKVFKNGDIVEVDANKGLVRKL